MTVASVTVDGTVVEGKVVLKGVMIVVTNNRSYLTIEVHMHLTSMWLHLTGKSFSALLFEH